MPLTPHFCAEHPEPDICPEKCLKPGLWLKMALWGWVGTAENLITPQSRQFKLCLQKWKTESGPGAGWKVCHIQFTFSFQKVALCGTSWGVFYELMAWLLRESLHSLAPSLSDVGCRWRVSVLHRADVWLRQMEQAVGAALALGGTQCCVDCIPGCNPFLRMGLLASGLYREIGWIWWLFLIEVSSEYLEIVQTTIWNTAVCSNSLASSAEVNCFLMSPVWCQCLI